MLLLVPVPLAIALTGRNQLDSNGPRFIAWLGVFVVQEHRLERRSPIAEHPLPVVLGLKLPSPSEASTLLCGSHSLSAGA